MADTTVAGVGGGESAGLLLGLALSGSLLDGFGRTRRKRRSCRVVDRGIVTLVKRSTGRNAEANAPYLSVFVLMI